LLGGGSVKALFLRVLEAEDKELALKKATQMGTHSQFSRRFLVDPSGFSAVPRSPFAYWVGEGTTRIFGRYSALGDIHLATRGAYTTDDFRFYRLSWEAGSFEAELDARESGRGRGELPPLAKGGAWSPYYGDIHLCVRWKRNGAEAKAMLSAYRESKGWGNDWSACLNGYSHYFRPGLTWSRRTTSGLTLRAMPGGSVFADKGPAAFVDGDDTKALFALLALSNSRAFGGLVEVQLAAADAAARSYEVGVIQRTPIPNVTPADRSALAAFARRAWSLKRSLDTRTENSHAYSLPALLQFRAGTLAACTAAWADRVRTTNAELAVIQAEIDDRCFALYGINDEDRKAITEGFGGSTASPPTDDAAGEEASVSVSSSSEPAGSARPTDDDSDPDESESTTADVFALTAELHSWSIGVAFGRFDIRLATGERALPPEPDPFDPLPVCSPGMLTGPDGLPCTTAASGYPIDIPPDGVLLDDPGHPRAITASARAVFDVVFGDDADARWQEAIGILDPKNHDLRAFVARTFFEQHLKRYSKSRRKAPIYWQLATPSASYSVWLYAHRVTPDTFFHVLNDVVAPKLGLEERKALSLTQEFGPNPTASQRKEIAAEESFVDELRAFRDEIARVAPLWNPDLDDGVVLTMAPLWRLVPQHRSWQKELKAAWDSLCAGEYDWAHLAMHLWPERVVPKCAADRSLAIAHGLEEVFWEEGAKGKWAARRTPLMPVATLVAERTSPAVKAALKDLPEAPQNRGANKGTRRGRTDA
jgi:hypothetical protein